MSNMDRYDVTFDYESEKVDFAGTYFGPANKTHVIEFDKNVFVIEVKGYSSTGRLNHRTYSARKFIVFKILERKAVTNSIYKMKVEHVVTIRPGRISYD